MVFPPGKRLCSGLRKAAEAGKLRRLGHLVWGFVELECLYGACHQSGMCYWRPPALAQADGGTQGRLGRTRHDVCGDVGGQGRRERDQAESHSSGIQDGVVAVCGQEGSWEDRRLGGLTDKTQGNVNVGRDASGRPDETRWIADFHDHRFSQSVRASHGMNSMG